MSDSDDGPTRPIKIRKFSKLTTGKKSLDESVDSDFEPPFRRPLKVPHSGKRIVELESSDECEVLEIIPVATSKKISHFLSN
jgi:hypothetical protein